MPELPEVETIRRQLEKELKGSRILSVQTTNPASFKPSFAVVEKNVRAKKIQVIERQAKLLIFKLEGGGWLLFHLKLAGRLLVRPLSHPADDYTHSVFELQTPQGKFLELRFADARKFGFVKLVKSAKEIEKLLAGFGPEPFKDLTFKKFVEILRSSSQAVKIVLMDQSKISGLGNIYANESLWLAKINPKTPAKNLNPSQTKKLYQAILTVLKRGLKYGGASDQRYRQVHGEQGKYQEHFLVYGRAGEKCQRCRNEIKRIALASRGTFFCPACQKLKYE